MSLESHENPEFRKREEMLRSRKRDEGSDQELVKIWRPKSKNKAMIEIDQ